jgi:hypothetical protein
LVQFTEHVCMLHYRLQLSTSTSTNTNTVYLIFSVLCIFSRLERNLLDRYQGRNISNKRHIQKGSTFFVLVYSGEASPLCWQ